MLRKIFLAACIGLTSMTGFSQSIDEKIANVINSADWFALDSIYRSAPKDSIDPYIEILSRGMLGHRFNHPDVSIPAFQEAFDTQSENLDLETMVSAAIFLGKDLSKMGQNELAASVINQALDVTRQDLDSVMVSELTSQANRYTGLAAYNPYQIQFNGDSIGKVPFAIVPIGPADKGGVMMRLRESSINGMPADIIFDTGCTFSIISPEMAEKYGLIPLEGTKATMLGMGKTDGYFAIAKELQLGNITVRDVPFSVTSIASNHSEADQYLDDIKIILGNDVMLQLKEITIDFITNNLTIPSKAPFIPVKTDAKPNMCFTPTYLLLCKCEIHNNPVLMLIDSGYVHYATIGEAFFENNKQYVLDNGIKDTVREAGIGGFSLNERYMVPNMKISLGGHTSEIPDIGIRTRPEVGALGSEGDGVIGLRTLMLYSFVRFNFVDFVLTTGTPRDTHLR
ncbi:MAG: retroviral-like aspartic protease family protein [Muribaculaceae bacterium]|nr:retroviral-like aspartic protease family protein [Muribaculaceae bacterium]